MEIFLYYLLLYLDVKNNRTLFSTFESGIIVTFVKLDFFNLYNVRPSLHRHILFTYYVSRTHNYVSHIFYDWFVHLFISESICLIDEIEDTFFCFSLSLDSIFYPELLLRYCVLPNKVITKIFVINPLVEFILRNLKSFVDSQMISKFFK